MEVAFWRTVMQLIRRLRRQAAVSVSLSAQSA
jgi:hypothetical protein